MKIDYLLWLLSVPEKPGQLKEAAAAWTGFSDQEKENFKQKAMEEQRLPDTPPEDLRLQEKIDIYKDARKAIERQVVPLTVWIRNLSIRWK